VADHRTTARSTLFSDIQRRAGQGDADALKQIQQASKNTGVPVPLLGASHTPSKAPSKAPSQLLHLKVVKTPYARARIRRSKIVEGTLPGTDVLRGEAYQHTESLAALFRQLFHVECFVTKETVHAVGSWMQDFNHTLDDGRRYLYLRASVPAYNGGREETWANGSLVSLFADMPFRMKQKPQSLYNYLLGRYKRMPERVREVLNGNPADHCLFEAAAGHASTGSLGSIPQVASSLRSAFRPPNKRRDGDPVA
jgi:hypothetical protein